MEIKTWFSAAKAAPPSKRICDCKNFKKPQYFNLEKISKFTRFRDYFTTARRRGKSMSPMAKKNISGHIPSSSDRMQCNPITCREWTWTNLRWWGLIIFIIWQKRSFHQKHLWTNKVSKRWQAFQISLGPVKTVYTWTKKVQGLTK